MTLFLEWDPDADLYVQMIMILFPFYLELTLYSANV